MLCYHFAIHLILLVAVGVEEQSVRVEEGVECLYSVERVLLFVDCALNTGSVLEFKQGVQVSFHGRAYLCGCLPIEELMDLTEMTVGIGRELDGQVAHFAPDSELG